MEFLPMTRSSFCDKKFLLMPRNFFLMSRNFLWWQEIFDCAMKFHPPKKVDAKKCLPVTGQFCLWQEFSSYDKKILRVTRHFFLGQEIHSCNKKLLLVTRNFFFWQKIYVLDKIFISVARDFFLWQLINCSARMFLSVTRKKFLHVVCDMKKCFIWQELRKYLEVKFAPKQCESPHKFRGSMAPWHPGNIPIRSSNKA